jgi:hypothetical protein
MHTSYHPTQTPASRREFVPPVPRASKGRVMRRGVRRFFSGIGAALRMLFSGRPLLVACLLLLLPLTGWLLYDRMFAPASSASSGGARVAVQLPEPPVIPQYFMAVQKGDADGVWNTFNATEKARRIARGEDKTILSQVLQIEQQAKMAYTAFHYVGSYQESDSARTALYFYVGDTGSGQQTRNVPLLFAVDSRGMIVEVLDSLYDAALSQLKGGP